MVLERDRRYAEAHILSVIVHHDGPGCQNAVYDVKGEHGYQEGQIKTTHILGLLYIHIYTVCQQQAECNERIDAVMV